MGEVQMPPLPPRDFSPENSAVICDFEGTATQYINSINLYRTNLPRALKATTYGVRDSVIDIIRNKGHNFKRICTQSVKKASCEGLTPEQRRQMGRRFYQVDVQRGLRDLLHVIDGDGYPFLILTSCDQEIVRGYLGQLNPEGEHAKGKFNYNIVGSNGKGLIWTDDKEEIAKKIKSATKYLVAIADAENDGGVLEVADFPFVVQHRILSKVFGGYKVRGIRADLVTIKEWFDYIHYRGQGIF